MHCTRSVCVSIGGKYVIETKGEMKVGRHIDSDYVTSTQMRYERLLSVQSFDCVSLILSRRGED